jgi:putative phage-type endonuclease
MEIIDCIQGSDEWLNVRRGVATASNFSKIVTSTGALSTSLGSYAMQLASEVITTLAEESYTNADMQRGNELEQEARSEYQQQELVIVEEVGFMSCDYYGYSPDGLVGKDGLIEIKCPRQNTHAKYLFNDKLPTEYKAQVQGGLLVSGREWCDFISYHPNFEEDKRLFIVRVERDEEFISALSDGLRKLEEKKNIILNKIRGKDNE